MSDEVLMAVGTLEERLERIEARLAALEELHKEPMGAVAEAAMRIQNLVAEECAKIVDLATALHEDAAEGSDDEALVMTEADCHHFQAEACRYLAAEIRALGG
jgi:predicted nuclease with TOPRIM domain